MTNKNRINKWITDKNKAKNKDSIYTIIKYNENMLVINKHHGEQTTWPTDNNTLCKKKSNNNKQKIIIKNSKCNTKK